MYINIKYILTVFLMVLATTAFATEQSVQQICKTLNTGDVKDFHNIFDSQVEMSILGESLVCNKDYAVNAVSDFASKNPRCVCKISHFGKRENSSFCIISIASAGKSFRLYALFRKVSDKQLIQQFRIDDVTE